MEDSPKLPGILVGLIGLLAWIPTRFPLLVSDNNPIGISSPIYAQGDSIYIGSNTGDFDNPEWHLEIFDISDSNSPVLVASTSGEGSIWDLKVFDETIFAGIAGQSIFEMQISPFGTIDIVDISHSLNTVGIDIYDIDRFYEIFSLEGYKYKKDGEEKTKGGGGVRKKKKKKKKNRWRILLPHNGSSTP